MKFPIFCEVLCLVLASSICHGFLATKHHYENEDLYKFEKSVAHIIKAETVETGNKFVVLFHSLNEKDENLNNLIRELNRNGIALPHFSMSMCKKLYVAFCGFSSFHTYFQIIAETKLLCAEWTINSA